MKYKLYNENIHINTVDDILKSRGIEDVKNWKNANWEQINNPSAFGEDIFKAVDILREAVREKWKICVIVD